MLSPFMFALYLNDLGDLCLCALDRSCFIILYADDTLPGGS